MTLLNSIHKRRQKNRCNSYLSSWKAISFIYIFFILFIQLFADPNLKEKVIENNVRNVKLRFLYIFCGKTVPFTSLAKCENHHEITQYRYCLLYKYTLLWWNCTRLLDGRRGTMCREDVDRGWPCIEAHYRDCLLTGEPRYVLIQITVYLYCQQKLTDYST